MLSRRIAILASVVAVTATSGASALAARGGGNSDNANKGPKQQHTFTYANHREVPACGAGADVCAASSSADPSTGLLSSSATIERTVATTGHDRSSGTAWIGRSFVLKEQAHSITATVTLTDVKAGATHAFTSDGEAFAESIVGAQIFDSGCDESQCGASTASTSVVVQQASSLLGQDTSRGGDSSATQVLKVTIAMPDGSLLPKGTISILGYSFAAIDLNPASCVSFTLTPQTCTSGTAHTGDGTAGISATLDSVTWEITP